MEPLRPELITLLDLSLRATALGAIVFLVVKLGRVRSAAFEHSLWSLCAASILLLPVLARLLPALALPILRAPAPIALAPATATLSFAAPRLTTTTIATEFDPAWPAFLWYAYLAVTAAFLLRFVIQWLRVTLLVRAAQPIWDTRALVLLAEPVPLKQSSKIAVPVTAGIFHPTILLPAGWSQWDDATLTAALLHESIHVRRHDPLLAFLSALNRCAFWFHPLVHWVEAKLRLLAEQATDDQCLAQLGDRECYAQILLHMAADARAHRGLRLWPAIAMARPSQVKQRIDRMLSADHRLSRSLTRAGWLLAIAVSAPVLYSAATLRLEQATPTRQQLRSPYAKWLDEDVVYIISVEERDNFLKLTADAGRESFILSFWASRDPTPETPKNEFKEEHYRRIAYANERYTAAAVPGWKTDRGRIYIIYGPPDEIEAHPSGSAERPTPWEDWRYGWLEGMGKAEFHFIDRARTGAYPLSGTTTTPDHPIHSPTLLSAGPRPVPGPRQIAVEIIPAEYTFVRSGNRFRMRVNVCGRVYSQERRVVNVFEDTVDIISTTGAPPTESRWFLQDLRMVAPGNYRVSLVLKDVFGKRVLQREMVLTVPAP